MALPDVEMRVADGALGLVDNDAQTTTAKLGVATGGTPNTIYAFSDKETLLATLIGGPVVEAAADTLNESGGTVLVGTIGATVPGTLGPVTHKGSGVGILTPSGAPNDAYSVVVTIQQPGMVGSASFKLSLDAGGSSSPELATTLSGKYPVDAANIALNFSPGPYAAGDVYSFECTAPGYSAVDATTAFGALLADARQWKLVHLVGAPASGDDASRAVGAAALAAAIGTQMASAATLHRYSRAILEAPDVADAALIAAFSNFVDARVAVAAGYIGHLSALTGRELKRSAAWPVATRAAKIPISQDLAWVGAPQGPLPSSVRRLYRDERKTPALDSARFITLRTLIGRRGPYITNPNTMALSNSDYSLLQNGLVMDAACAASYDAMLDYLSATLTVDDKRGTIDEVDAVAAEAKVIGKVGAVVLQPGHVSALSVRINRTDNILSNRKLRWKVRAIPKAYPKFIEVEIGFLNPALAILPAA